MRPQHTMKCTGTPSSPDGDRCTEHVLQPAIELVSKTSYERTVGDNLTLLVLGLVHAPSGRSATGLGRSGPCSKASECSDRPHEGLNWGGSCNIK